MKLKTFLDKTNAKEFADLLGIPAGLLSQWKTGKKSVPVRRCIDIERCSEGKVTRKDLRPNDYFEIWPELTASKKT
jgi:DNA-binding transcriptional regulator YdaS (Cro superfamily)